MVWPGFVIFVPYANQRFAEVRIMLFDRRDRCVPVWPTPMFSRGIGLVLDMFLGNCSWGLSYLGLLFMHMPLFSKTMFFTSCVVIKSRHILRLIIHTVNYQFKAAVVVPDSTSPGFV